MITRICARTFSRTVQIHRQRIVERRLVLAHPMLLAARAFSSLPVRIELRQWGQAKFSQIGRAHV